ncbi:MAG TPA: hypothetical protein VKY89_08270 [Thermoanaerobaculia bacterium]|nr:hypothetical protein [Thermoanaerobaculia bacterium]
MRTRALATLCTLLLPWCGGVAASATTWDLVNACAFAGTGGDEVSRGFYLTAYPGSNLSQVELGYTAANGHAGLWSISLTARRGSYDGPIVGTTQIATVGVPQFSNATEALVVFDFNGAPVTPGDTITFTQTAQQLGGTGGSGELDFDTGSGPCTNVTETNGTSPPLDGFRRATVGIVVTEHKPPINCIASDTVMCIDSLPGDQRFKATVTFHTTQAGGAAGSGNEIPLAPLGLDQGGMFWFFNPDNPEMLVKVIDGCAVNGRFWVFISAGTNVGYSITVTDTAFGATKTYTNNDLTPAVPVQDTSALTGCT